MPTISWPECGGSPTSRFRQPVITVQDRLLLCFLKIYHVAIPLIPGQTLECFIHCTSICSSYSFEYQYILNVIFTPRISVQVIVPGSRILYLLHTTRELKGYTACTSYKFSTHHLNETECWADLHKYLTIFKYNHTYWLNTKIYTPQEWCWRLHLSYEHQSKYWNKINTLLFSVHSII